MKNNVIYNILIRKYPQEIVENLLENYFAALNEFRKENWKYFGNEVGQFIEDCERLIDFQLTNRYIPFSKKLPIFDSNILLKWENCSSSFDETYRLLIPRILFSMNCIRNKRGMIHKNHIVPNKMDAILLLNNMKWIIAELIRLNSNLSFDDTNDTINLVVEKEIDIIWEIDGKSRILRKSKSCKDQVLFFLYKYQKLSTENLFEYTEYSNKTRFNQIIKSLHKDRLLELSNGECTISPIGVDYVEKIVKNEAKKKYIN
ncbi:MAG: hypothetical protein HFI73_02380 [Bacilli bacterium]|jgi:hypothetical protein|nr:hypothetical protein [Bacilli bacterium]